MFGRHVMSLTVIIHQQSSCMAFHIANATMRQFNLNQSMRALGFLILSCSG